MLHEKVNQYRVVPRIIAGFVMYMAYKFHNWFTNDGLLLVTDMSEWALLGYASVMGAHVAFFKFYMDTNGSKTHD